MLKALQEVACSSPKLILWLYHKVFQASTHTSSIHLIWIPGYRGISLNKKAGRLAHNINSFSIFLEWISPEDLLHHCRHQTLEDAAQQYQQCKYYASHGAIPSITLSSFWITNRRDDVLISRLVCKMIITLTLPFHFHLIEDGFCKVPDSLEYILFHSYKYQQQQITFFSSTFLIATAYLLFHNLPRLFLPLIIFVLLPVFT